MLSLCNQPAEILEALKAYAVNPKGFMLLAGKNGTGKTFAAQTVFDEFFPRDFHPEFQEKLFYTQADLNLLWQKQMADWGNCLYILEKIVYSKLLVLDDIGTRVPSEAFMDFLYSIVDKRYREKDSLGTILTTNLNAQSMREKFGDAFVSRVASGICFRLEGEDRRFKDF